ncbi:MAG: hypothetical protein WCP97_06675 [bacterium]
MHFLSKVARWFTSALGTIVFWSLFWVLLAIPLVSFSAEQPSLSSLGDNPLSLAPKLVERNKVKPGDALTFAVTLKNSSTATLALSAVLEEYYPYPDKKVTTSPLLTWLQLSQRDFSLAPKESTKISATITVPKDTAAGSYMAKIVFAPTINGQRVADKYTQNVIVVVNVVEVEKVVENVTLEQFAVEPSDTQYGPVTFKTTLTNHGSGSVFPKGEIVVKDFLGTEVDRVPFQYFSERQLFPPGETVTFKTQWDSFLLKDPEALPYQWNFLQEFTFDTSYWDKLRVGSYTAELELSYGEQGKTIAGSALLFVFPWRFLLYVLSFVVLGLIVLDEILRFYRNKIRVQIFSEVTKIVRER